MFFIVDVDDAADFAAAPLVGLAAAAGGCAAGVLVLVSALLSSLEPQPAIVPAAARARQVRAAGRRDMGAPGFVRRMGVAREATRPWRDRAPPARRSPGRGRRAARGRAARPARRRPSPRPRTWSTPWPPSGREAGRARLAHVEVAAEDDRRARRPSASVAARGALDVRPRALGRVRPARGGSRTTCRRRARTAWQTRRSGQRRSSSARCSAIALAPRTRIAFAPPPLDLMRSGAAHGDRAAQRRAARCATSARVRALGVAGARERRRPPRRDLLQQRDVPRPSRRARPRTRSSRSRPARRDGAAVEEVPGEDAHCAHTLPDLTRHLLTGTELDRDELRRAARPRRRAEGGAAVLARARGPQRRADLREALDAHAAVVRGGRLRARRPPDRPAPRRDAALARRVGRRHRARPLAPRRGDRHPHRARRAARGARRRRRRCRSSTCSPPAITRARRSPTS